MDNIIMKAKASAALSGGILAWMFGAPDDMRSLSSALF